jgi:hypothetical protein
VLQRYVVRILLMCVYCPYVCTKTHVYRVPIYAASSWASLVSLTASAYVEPLRDVYEVGISSLSLSATDDAGLHHLHIPATPHQLHRRRARPDHPHDRPSARIAPLAAEPGV